MFVRLLLLALLAFLGYTLWNALRRSLGGPPTIDQRQGGRAGDRGEEMVRDPHCGTFVPRGEAVEGMVDGQRHYFCSQRCRDAFTKP